jgi:di/tricarboxylate transporter
VTWEAWLTLAIIVGVVAVMARDLVQPSVAILGAVVVLFVAGVIDADQAFSGFANPAPIAVAALFVLARGVEVSGLLQPLVQRLLGAEAAGSRSGRLQLARLLAPTAAASGLLNNTPLVAMTAPSVVEWSNQRGVPASRFLIPLSYAAVLGGTITAIGTSTNLVVSGLLSDAGMDPLGLFELAPVGLPLAAAGCLVVVVLARRLLPERSSALERFGESAREFTVAMRVVPGGGLDGRSIEAAGLRHLQGVYLVQVDRGDQVIAPVSPDELVWGEDVLTFVGRVDRIVDLQRQRGLVSTEARHLERLDTRRHTFFEAVVGVESPLVGRTLREAGFRGRYQAAVVAIHRAGQRLDAQLGQVRLRTGDTLLVLADPGFRSRWRETGDFVLVAGHEGSPPPANRSAPLVAGVVVGLAALAATGVLSILQAALVAAIALLALRVLTVAQARAAVDLDVIVVIAAAFGLGAAVSSSGLGEQFANVLLGVFEPFGLVGAVAGVLLATMVLTELISNNAAAVLIFPVALSVASSVGADPRPFAIAVALGASLSFLTPVGYQTNLMVYGLGGYRFSDYTRLGTPVSITAIVLCLVLIPRVFPF